MSYIWILFIYWLACSFFLGPTNPFDSLGAIITNKYVWNCCFCSWDPQRRLFCRISLLGLKLPACSLDNRKNKKEKSWSFMHLWLEKMKVHLYSLRDQSDEKQVRFDIKLASGLYTGVSLTLFKLDELNLIIWWMTYFFYYYVLVKPQMKQTAVDLVYIHFEFFCPI